MKYQHLFSFILILVISACETVASIEPTVSMQPDPRPANEVDLPTIAPTQTILPEPTPAGPVEKEAENFWNGTQMPIFLEVTQTTMMGKNSVQRPALGVGPTIYFYNPDSKLLMLHSTITLESATELLVGVNTILQTPGQVYEKREIVQFPSAQPALMQIEAFDVGTGILHLVHESETFNLSPDESRTFKQVGSDTNASTVVTIVSNHGHLADIQVGPSDGSWR